MDERYLQKLLSEYYVMNRSWNHVHLKSEVWQEAMPEFTKGI